MPSRQLDCSSGSGNIKCKLNEEVLRKVFLKTLEWPVQCVKFLVQLGYDPFPLSIGKAFILIGRETVFLPNALSYARQLAAQHGFRILFTGYSAGCIHHITHSQSSRYVKKFIDKNYPEIGGIEEVPQEAEEKDLTDHQSFKRQLRNAIRESVVVVAATVVSHPFLVVCVRQIGQIIGGEMKYGNIFSSLKLIGNEEGPAGLFGGLAPRLIQSLLIAWGISGLQYLSQRVMVHAGVYAGTDDRGKTLAGYLQTFLIFSSVRILEYLTHPYTIVSRIKAVEGSGLEVSLPPYSPHSERWEDLFVLLRRNELRRGYRLIYRAYHGSIYVAPDENLYRQQVFRFAI